MESGYGDLLERECPNNQCDFTEPRRRCRKPQFISRAVGSTPFAGGLPRKPFLQEKSQCFHELRQSNNESLTAGARESIFCMLLTLEHANFQVSTRSQCLE